ncbi:hypothetical protein ACRAWD_01205 [Caulobacter segnis]
MTFLDDPVQRRPRPGPGLCRRGALPGLARPQAPGRLDRARAACVL